MKVIEAGLSDLDAVAILFDAYRQFYEQESDIEGAKAFIESHMKNGDSVIFLALSESNEPVGFAQLYPSFSSVAMKRMWYLNDLYVSENIRKQGAGRTLLQRVAAFAKDTDAVTVKLATAVSNEKAKSLYESEGYVKVTAFEHYSQRVKLA
ncbi:GNAT family N-acetyltransferase [Vibrio mimicus]|uniref:GNAT family N-acetyltransferase n=1 Tax=Vibrio mimicus TaxID=674 RepID=UPI002F94DCCF